MPDNVSTRARRDIKRIRDYLELGNYAAAAAAAEATSLRFKQLPAAWYWRALAEQLSGRHAIACAHAERAIALDSEQVEFFAVLARSQLARGDIHLAVASAMRAVALNPGDVATLDVLAEVLQHGGALEQALMLLERALSKEPESPALLLSRAQLLRAMDRRDSAEAAFESILALRPNNGPAHWGLAQLGGWSREHHHLQRLDALAGQLMPKDPDRCWIDYARYLEHEALGTDEIAIAALLRGAADRRAQFRFDTDSNTRVFARMKQLLTQWEPGTNRIHTPGSSDASLIPVFVFGMPRSGIGLVAAMLGQHNGVQNAGESREFATCVQRVLGIEKSSFLDENIAAELHRVDWDEVAVMYRARLVERFGAQGIVTERLPANYIYAAAIARALPEARLVRVVREPMDNCFSMFRQMYVGVNPFSFDQVELAQHYVAYEDWMRSLGSSLPDRMLILRYEQLVGVPTLVGRALFRFCGLDWNDEYAALPQNSTLPGQVGAALVNGPLHGRAVARWRRYEAALEPMFRVLAAAGLGPRQLL